MQNRLSRHVLKLPNSFEIARNRKWYTPSKASWTENLSAVDVEHMQEGVGIILNYLNSGNAWEDLADIETSAKHWCRVYYSTLKSTYYVPEAVMAQHPHLFNLDIASWLRLDNFENQRNPSSTPNHEENRKHEFFRAKSHLVRDRSNKVPPPLYSAEPGRDDDDNTKPSFNDRGKSPPSVSNSSEKFPGYSEPSILRDQDLVNILASYDLAKAWEGPAPDKYREHRVPFTAADLLGSPIIFHFPEVIRNLAELDVDLAIEKQVGFEEEVDLDAGLFLQGLAWARLVSHNGIYHDALEMDEKISNDVP